MTHWHLCENNCCCSYDTCPGSAGCHCSLYLLQGRCGLMATKVGSAGAGKEGEVMSDPAMNKEVLDDDQTAEKKDLSSHSV